MLVYLLASALLLIHPSPVFAQDLTPTSLASPTATPELTPTSTPQPTPTPDPVDVLFNQYQKDYLFSYDLYQKSYLDYINKKQVHTKYNTVTTEKDKIEATKKRPCPP